MALRGLCSCQSHERRSGNRPGSMILSDEPRIGMRYLHSVGPELGFRIDIPQSQAVSGGNYNVPRTGSNKPTYFRTHGLLETGTSWSIIRKHVRELLHIVCCRTSLAISVYQTFFHRLARQIPYFFYYHLLNTPWHVDLKHYSIGS